MWKMKSRISGLVRLCTVRQRDPSLPVHLVSSTSPPVSIAETPSARAGSLEAHLLVSFSTRHVVMVTGATTDRARVRQA